MSKMPNFFRFCAPSPLKKWGRAGLLLAAIFAVSLSAADAHAYAWMIKNGYAKCNNCHTDPSGGETLNHMGRVSSQTLLSQRWGDDTSLSDTSKLLFGVDEPDGVRLGGSLRSMAIYDVDSSSGAAFPMQADVYGNAEFGPVRIGASFGASRASGRWEHTDKAVLVGQLKDDEMVAVSRSHWLGFEIADQMLLRAGRIAMPFGLRLTEHTLWVRDETKTDRESDQSHGLAFSYNRGHLRAELMAVAGNFQLRDSDTQERGYSGFLEYLLDSRTAVGVSSQFLTAKKALKSGLPDPSRHAHGVTARYSPMQPLALLFEADALFTSNTDFGYVGVLMADYEPLQGLHVMLTGEALNRGKPKADPVPIVLGMPADPAGLALLPESMDTGPGNGETRLGGWASVNWFPISHIDLRVDVVARQNRPLLLQAQGHFYF